MKILLTGGSGRLGIKLQEHLACYAPSHSELDITKFETIVPNCDAVIHSAAYTNVVLAETERKQCFDTNVLGTINLLKKYPDKPFIFISSEYAHNPTTYYSETKLAGEVAVKALSNRYLIIRTIFKPHPWPFDKAFIDQYTQGDYVDVIAPLIVAEIKYWDKKTSKLVYVGTGRKTMYELAKKTKPDVIPNSVADIKDVKIPRDYL